MEKLFATLIILASGSILAAFWLVFEWKAAVDRESQIRREKAALASENAQLRKQLAERNAVLKQTLCECEAHLQRDI